MITKNNINALKHGSIVSPKGFFTTGIHTGVKRKRNDLGLIYSKKPAQAAAVYTQNKIQAAPIIVTKKTLEKSNTLQAVIVNSGNANACTGKEGIQDAHLMQQLAANLLHIPTRQVAVASTGIIGLSMPMEKISAHIEHLKVGHSKDDADQFAESILTTDTFTKSACYEGTIDQQTITVAGVAKGSGMIEPNMGTMLAFLTTDARIEATYLRTLLKQVTDRTFNCITVDGDTSTNDMVLMMANGCANNEPLTPKHPNWFTFVQMVEKTCESLAKQIAKDGEGATKLIEVNVTGAENDQEARQVAKTIVGSSLVKTAVYGNDANWGRIIAAIGYSGAQINPEAIDIFAGPIQFIKNSQPLQFSETEATDYFKRDSITIFVNLNLKDGQGKAWGCDLTYDYVRINATYRT